MASFVPAYLRLPAGQLRVPFRERHGGASGPVAALIWIFLAGCTVGDPPEGQDGRGPAPGPAVLQSSDSAYWAARRRLMVERHLVARDIRDEAVLRVMGEVPRHRFVPDDMADLAYTDQPLPIGLGQTISQPYIVAFMAQAAGLEPDDRVLEVGTGSGYGAAVLAGLAGEVYTVEILPELAERARRTLEELGFADVHVRTGNGWLGWPEHAPFDAVVVTAAPDEVPGALVDQLGVGGTLVIPVGETFQRLRVLRKTAAGMVEVASLPVRFVPMVGKPGDTLP